MKVLYLTSRLTAHGTGQVPALLARTLPRPTFAPEVVVLDDPCPPGKDLAAAGVPIHYLPCRRLIDLQAHWRLRRLVRHSRPDIVHVWGLDALRALRIAAGWRVPVVLSGPFQAGKLGPIDRFLVRGADRVLVHSKATATRCGQLGVGDARLRLIPPAVESRADPTGEAPSAGALPPGARCIAVVGECDAFIPFRDTIWAFDILRFLYADLHLIFLDSGANQSRLTQFARDIRCAAHVHFLGDTAAGPALLERAEVVWVPGRGEPGMFAALTALAAGRPVVAWADPAVAPIIEDGTTGLLAPPGRQSELARQTRLLLDEPERRRQLGEAGRRRAAEQFPPSELVRGAAVLYQEMQTPLG